MYENTVTLTGKIQSIEIIQKKGYEPTAKVVISSGSECHSLFFSGQLAYLFLKKQRRLGDPLLNVGTDIQIQGKLTYCDEDGYFLADKMSNAVLVFDLIWTGSVLYVTRAIRERMDRLSGEDGWAF